MNHIIGIRKNLINRNFLSTDTIESDVLSESIADIDDEKNSIKNESCE